jgi:hypothetical protein
VKGRRKKEEGRRKKGKGKREDGKPLKNGFCNHGEGIVSAQSFLDG